MYKKYFANKNNDLRINEMLYSKVRSSRVVINGKKGLDLTFTLSKNLPKFWNGSLSVKAEGGY